MLLEGTEVTSQGLHVSPLDLRKVDIIITACHAAEMLQETPR